MIQRDNLRFALYAAVVVFILTLTGIFGSFDTRSVISSRPDDFLRVNLSLSAVLLVLAVGGGGYVMAHRVREGGASAAALNGAVGSLVTGLVLAVLLFIEAKIDIANVNMRFVFPDMGRLVGSSLTFNDADVTMGIIKLLVFSAVLGALLGLLFAIPLRLRNNLFLALGITVIIGLLQIQIRNIIALADALTIVGAINVAYIVVPRFKPVNLQMRLLYGAGIGAAIGMVLALLANSGAFTPDGFLHVSGTSDPTVLAQELSVGEALLPFIIVFGIAGAVGAVATVADRTTHGGVSYFATTLIALGVLNWQGEMNALLALITFVLMFAAFWFTPTLASNAEKQFATLTRSNQQSTRRIAAAIGLAVMLVAPSFLGQYISNVLNLVALYIVMGIGLNVMIGFAGLLDLGYVASFAIGAYTAGLLMTPSLVTCGAAPSNITPEMIANSCHIFSFWAAWPVAVFVSAVTGMLLGVPVLRLRGDYLAIVTLGFGQIANLLIKSNDLKDLLGSAQGITPIPVPTVDLTFINDNWHWTLNNSQSIYYVFLFSVLVAAFVVSRLAHSRVGRGWRAVRSDEDVAEAMGIHLVWTKLLAFGVSSAFAGMGGALFGSSLQGIFPDSFSIAVSINVVSLIIIGGLGSIPGVVVGAFMLVGLPEALRELQDYRLLGFGVLLVVSMLLKPQGLLPPQPERLGEKAVHEFNLEPSSAEIKGA